MHFLLIPHPVADDRSHLLWWLHSLCSYVDEEVKRKKEWDKLYNQ